MQVWWGGVASQRRGRREAATNLYSSGAKAVVLFRACVADVVGCKGVRQKARRASAVPLSFL